MPQVRAKTFWAAKTGTDVTEVDVPVVGGHAGVTILPLFSQVRRGGPLTIAKGAHLEAMCALAAAARWATACVAGFLWLLRGRSRGVRRVQATPSSDDAGLPHAEIEALTKRTQDGGTEVVVAKAGKVRRRVLKGCFLTCWEASAWAGKSPVRRSEV